MNPLDCGSQPNKLFLCLNPSIYLDDLNEKNVQMLREKDDEKNTFFFFLLYKNHSAKCSFNLPNSLDDNFFFITIKSQIS